MDKKILIGSIIAIAILVVASLTSVVGYKSIGYGVKASPLFTVRSSRAIEEVSREFTSNYIGKGYDIKLSFPTSNSRNIQIQRFIDIIRKMDNKTYNKFLYQLINQIQKRNELTNVNINELIINMNQIRNKPDMIVLDNSGEDDNPFTYVKWFFPTICWFPGCFFLITLIWSLLLIDMWIQFRQTSICKECSTL